MIMKQDTSEGIIRAEARFDIRLWVAASTRELELAALAKVIGALWIEFQAENLSPETLLQIAERLTAIDDPDEGTRSVHLRQEDVEINSDEHSNWLDCNGPISQATRLIRAATNSGVASHWTFNPQPFGYVTGFDAKHGQGEEVRMWIVLQDDNEAIHQFRHVADMLHGFLWHFSFRELSGIDSAAVVWRDWPGEDPSFQILALQQTRSSLDLRFHAGLSELGSWMVSGTPGLDWRCELVHSAIE